MATKAPSTLDNLQNMISLFKPPGGSTTTTTGGSTTTTEQLKSDVSDDQVAAIVKSMLEGKDGMAALAPMQHAAGMYNSSTQTLLQNDLMARTAAEAAKLRKVDTRTVNQVSDPKVTAVKPTAQLSATGTAGTALGLKLASSLLGPTLKKAGSVIGLDKIGDKIANTAFGNDATPDAGPSVTTDPMAGGITDKWDNGSTYSGMSGFTGSTDFGFNDGGADSLSGADLSGMDQFLPSASDAVGDLTSSLIGDSASDAASSAAGDLASDAFSDAASDSIGGAASDELFKQLQDEASSSAGDIVSSFFANGGRVPSKSKPKRYFADGGRVAPDTLYDEEFAKGPQITQINRALDESGGRDQNAANATGAVTLPRPVLRSTKSGSSAESLYKTDTEGQQGENAANADGSFGTPGSFGALGASAALGALGIGAGPGVLGFANAVSQSVYGVNAISAIAQALGIGGNNALGGTAGSGSANAAGTADGSDVGESNASIGGETIGGTSGTIGGGDADADNGADALGGTDGMGGVGGDSDSGAEGEGEGGSGEGGDGGDGGDGGSMKNGGALAGHDTQGKDNIQIHVSGGEYVIPTDVVDHLGEDFFDNIINKYHKPL